mgnify:FL=1
MDDLDSRAGVSTDDGVKPRALESGTTRRGSVDRKKIAPNLKLGCFITKTVSQIFERAAAEARGVMEARGEKTLRFIREMLCTKREDERCGQPSVCERGVSRRVTGAVFVSWWGGAAVGSGGRWGIRPPLPPS